MRLSGMQSNLLTLPELLPLVLKSYRPYDVKATEESLLLKRASCLFPTLDEELSEMRALADTALDDGTQSMSAPTNWT